MTIFLKHLIVEHHIVFKELYPSKSLLPKHFMVHYPRCIRQIGPLIHIWSMRFEAKHTFFKDCVKKFKNLTVSLANKHQFAVACHWECLSSKSVESGPVNVSTWSSRIYRRCKSASWYWATSHCQRHKVGQMLWSWVSYWTLCLHRHWEKLTTFQQNSFNHFAQWSIFCFVLIEHETVFMTIFMLFEWVNTCRGRSWL